MILTYYFDIQENFAKILSMATQNSKKGNNQNQPEVKYNEYIDHEEFLLIDENGASLGKKTKKEALQIAKEKDTDIILVSESPAVARLNKFGKFLYKKKKTDKMKRKNQTSNTTKNIEVGCFIDTNDLERKISLAEEFLSEGTRVIVTMKFRKKRERTNENKIKGKKIIEHIMKKLDELGKCEDKTENSETIEEVSSFVICFSPKASKTGKKTSQNKEA